MDGKIMEEVRGLLFNRWRRLLKGSDRDQRDNIDESDAPQIEIIDIAQSLEQLGRDTSLAEQERKELLAIERALTKMASGTFGVCEDCGEDIPVKRLMVLPEARLCANCQAFEERQFAKIRSTGISA